MHNALRHLRISQGLTEQQLADKLNVSVEIISLIESGIINRLASFFNVPIDYLLINNSRKTERHSIDQIQLLEIYDSLNDISKGILLERALSLAEKKSK